MDCGFIQQGKFRLSSDAELGTGVSMHPFRVAPILSVLLSALLLVSATARAAVDPALLDLVPPRTQVLYGIQVQQTLSSPFGQFVLSRMPDNRAALLQFAAATGFDLQRDLREVLLAGSARPARVDDPAFLALGPVHTAHFIAQL